MKPFLMTAEFISKLEYSNFTITEQALIEAALRFMWENDTRATWQDELEAIVRKEQK